MSHIPDFDEIMAVASSHGEDSEAPGLWDGLVAWWPMQEGAGRVAFDASRYSHHGSLQNLDATNRVVTAKGRAIDFETSDQHILITDTDRLRFGAGSLSILGWVFLDSFGENSQGRIVDKFSVSPTDGWGLQVRDSGGEKGLQYNFYASGSGKYPRAEGCIDVGKWYHVALLRNPSATRFLVNAIERSVTGDASGGPDPGTSDVYLGRAAWSTARDFDGRITHLRLYERTLSPAEVVADYSDPWAIGRLRRRVFPAAVAGGGALSGTVTLGLSAAANLAGSGSLAGSSDVSLAASGTMAAAGRMSGTVTLGLSAAANLAGSGSLAGSSWWSVTLAGILGGDGACAGSAALLLSASAAIWGSGALAGTTDLHLGLSGSLARQPLGRGLAVAGLAVIIGPQQGRAVSSFVHAGQSEVTGQVAGRTL